MVGKQKLLADSLKKAKRIRSIVDSSPSNGRLDTFYLPLTLFGCLTGIAAVLFGFGGGFVVVPPLYRMLTASHGADDPISQSAMHIAVCPPRPA